MTPTSTLHLLDVGNRAYGDAMLLQVGTRTVLIDGAHPGDERAGDGRADLTGQLEQLLQQSPPFEIDLLVVSHGHLDHIGALPSLVNEGLVEFEWALVADPDLAWGRPGGADSARRADSTAAVLAALREEPMPPEASDTSLTRWMADAVTLEERYRSMLERLRSNGTRVIRHVRDDHAPLERSFRSQGLLVVGPSEAQVLLCADMIATATDAVDAGLRQLTSQDRNVRQVDLYRAARRLGADSASSSDASRLGEAVNLQSLILSVTLAGNRVLLGGDMPFADPGVGDRRLRRELDALVARIDDIAPFAFTKAPHHGSANGMDGSLLDRLGTPIVVGISTGSDSHDHPNPALLSLLQERAAGLHWVRTDRNGRSAIRLDRNRKVSIDVSRGSVDDPTPPRAPQPDLTGPVRPLPAVVGPAQPAAPIGGGGPAEMVEVTVRLPAGRSQRVIVEITPSRDAQPQPDRARAGQDGRLSGILAVTSSEALTANIGQTEVRQALDALDALGATLLDLPPNLAVDATSQRTREAVATHGSAGVLLLGGYEVVPSQTVDTLPPEIRARMTANDDQDDFVVWSDDAYGDRDGDGLAELPIARVPDARSPQLVSAALGAPAVSFERAAAIRNFARPFADRVYASIVSGSPMLISEPTRPGPPQHPVPGELIYLMLHGDYENANAFEGELAGGRFMEAIDVTDVGPAAGAVIFAGCCWGALPVDTTALQALSGRRAAPWPPERSMALTYLSQGARAFVGCTGVHYSPVDPPLYHYGEPMHHFFFEQLLGGSPPAVALHEAKRRYVTGIPYGPRDLRSQAIEYKIWRQFTCLGIGW